MSCDGTSQHAKELIRLKYDTTAEGYDELYREEQFEKYRFVVRSVEGAVLDSGCGTALLLEYLSLAGYLSQVKYYVCLDFSEGMLGVARRRVKVLNMDVLVDFVQADVEYLPLRGCVVDYSFSVTVLSLLEYPQQAVRELARVTRRSAIFTLLNKVVDLLGVRYRGRVVKDYVYEVKTVCAIT